MNRDEMTWLVLRAQAGDRESLEPLLAAIQKPLLGYLVHLTCRRELAEEVLQEVLFVIYRKLDWLRDPALFEAWAFRIASRAAWRALARTEALREEPLTLDTAAENSEEPVDRGALLEALPRHLDALSPASRAVLSLHYSQGMSILDAAGVLGIPVGTAKSRLAYGLRCLRRAFAGEVV